MGLLKEVHLYFHYQLSVTHCVEEILHVVEI